MPVSQILQAKGREVFTASSTDKIEQIARKLAQHRIGAIVILDASGAIAGIVSERDIVRLVAEAGAGALDSRSGYYHDHVGQDLPRRRR